MRIFLLLLILLTGCTYVPDTEVEVVLLNRHPFEEFFPVPYYIEYTYSNEIRTVYLYDGIKRVSIKVKRGENSIIRARPFALDGPTLGGCYQVGDKKVTLEEKEGHLAYALLEAFYYNHNVIKVLNYDFLLSKLPQSFDVVAFIKEITEGNFRSFKKLEKVKFSLVDLPSGWWYSSNSEVMNLNFPDGEKKEYKMELYPGIYSFYNNERKLLFIIEISGEGKIYSKMQSK